jgi:hypothetical protein
MYCDEYFQWTNIESGLDIPLETELFIDLFEYFINEKQYSNKHQLNEPELD